MTIHPTHHVSPHERGDTARSRVLRYGFVLSFLLLTFCVLPSDAFALTLSGTIYTDSGTAIDTTGGRTISLRVDGAGTYSTTTISGTGSWYIEGITTIATGTALVIFTDNDATFRATTVTVASSSVYDITGLDVYKDHVIVKNESPTGTTTIAHLDTYDSTDDADIPYTASTTPFTCGVSTMTGDNDITYGTVLGEDGNCWLDRNLGASRVATAFNDSQSYGYYYQWGRGNDGHQISTSATTSTLSTTDTPGHGDFILNSTSPFDWRNPQNPNLWQGVSGTNNVCPAGFRLPTNAEWSTYVANASITNSATAYASNLKLPVAGHRGRASGVMVNVGSGGGFWSSGVSGTNARNLYFFGSNVYPSSTNNRAHGLTVRCLKDPDPFINLSISSLLVHASTTLYVAPNTTFAPGGAVTVAGNATQNPLDGTLRLAPNATYLAGGDTTLAGSYRASSTATFTPGLHTLVFNATTSGKTLTHEPTTSLGAVTFNGAGGGWSFATSATTSSLTITTGAVTAPDTLTVTGDFTQGGSFDTHTGTTVFANTSPQTLSGTMNTPTTDFNHLVFSGTGTKTLTDTASTTSMTVGLGSTLTLGSATTSTTTLALAGNLTNPGAFTNLGTFTPNQSTVTLTGTTHTLTGTTTFYHLTKIATTSATTTFSAGDLFTVTGTWDMQGTTTAPHVMQSSVPGEHWYVDPQGERVIKNISVQDSYNVSTLINCVYEHFCTDLGNNVNWNFLFFGSDRDEQFYVGQATTTLSRLTFMEGLSGTGVTAANDIRITIPYATTDFRFDTNVSTLTFGGTGAKKVSPTVSYEDDGRTLVVSVLEDFSRSDMLLVDGMRVGSFLSISTTSARLALHLDGNTTGEPASYDVRTVRVTGAIERGDHGAGQVTNSFAFLNGADSILYRFALTPIAEHATMTALTLDLAPFYRMEGILTTVRLYRDVNGDGAIDGGDTLVGGAGVLTAQGSRGSITFSEPFTITEATEYLLVADRSGDTYARMMSVDIPTSGMNAVGFTSGVKPVVIGSVSPVEHRHGRLPQIGGRDGGDPVGGVGPVGSPVSGGGSGGGSTPTPPQEEETIGDDTRFKAPQVSGAFLNEWLNGANALASNNTYAATSTDGAAQSYSTFDFGIPGGDTIVGVTVKLEASTEGGAGGTMNIALSWNGGVEYTDGVSTLALTTTDTVYTVGGENDQWGRSWTPAYFTDGTFVVRVIAHPDGNVVRLDALQVYVKHAATGGSSGGGSNPI